MKGSLFLDCVVKFFVRVHHVLMSLLNVIKLLLLIGRQQRTNLRRSAIHDRFHLLHRLLMDRGDLRLGLIDDRLDLGLLIGRQVQLLGQMFKPKSVSAAPTMAGLSLRHCKAAEGYRTRGRKC